MKEQNNFSLKRNQVIITVLVFMIAVAAYLNTQQTPDSLKPTSLAMSENTYEPEEIDFFSGYNEQMAEVEDNQTADINNEEVALNLDESTGSDSINATITKKDATLNNEDVTVSKNIETDYFAEEKLAREQSRAEQVEQLTTYVANNNLDQDAKSKAAANLIEIQERIEKENSAEALLKAKGFNEVYVRIDNDTVDVVINKAELSDTDIAQIEEIVNRKTGYSVGKINITPLNTTK